MSVHGGGPYDYTWICSHLFTSLEDHHALLVQSPTGPAYHMDLFKLVHFETPAPVGPVGKRAIGLRLKGLLVLQCVQTSKDTRFGLETLGRHHHGLRSSMKI